MASADKQILFTVAPSGGGGGSTLSAVAASLSSNQWATLTIGTTSLDPTGVGDGMLSYCQRMEWDATNGLMRFFGGTHGGSSTAHRQFLATYVASTNSWQATQQVPGGVQPFQHGFYQGTVDTQTGDVVGINGYTDATLPRRFVFSSSTWTTYPNKTGRTNANSPIQFHPGLYGGAGGFVMGSDGGIWTMNRAGTWTRITDQATENAVNAMGDSGQVAAYNAKDGCVYIGCGNVQRLWKVPASAGAGTPVEVAVPPVSLGVWDSFSGSTRSALLSSGNPANRLIAFGKGGGVYEYNEVANTWSAVSTSVPAALLSAPDALFAGCAISTHNCIMFIKAQSFAVMSSTAHIWKR